MATAGSRDKNPFSPGGSLGSTKYYLLVDKDGPNKGRITIKSPTVAGNVGGSSLDRTVGVIPLDNAFQPEPGSTTSDELRYFSSADGQKAVKNQGVITVQKSGVPQQQAQQLIFPNAATSSATPPPAAPLPPPDGGVADFTPVALDNPTITPDSQNLDFGSNDNLRYPLNLKTSKQDYIQFSMETNEGRSLSGGGDGIFQGLGGRNPTTAIKGTVTLPIQPGITDSNGVEWGGQNLDAKDAYLASLALGGITSDQGLGANAGSLLGRVFNDIKNAAAGDTSEGQNFKKAINLYLAQEAVGVQGLLSRASGAILNPNLELLFNGPTLRSFTFTFRLSPRGAKEAENVRRIIRFFKEGMSVKTASSEVFLKSPNLFNIKYIAAGTDKEHKSLPKIKKCALLGCDVDYTPDGTYMTFNDEAKTMTSYQLSLRFSEIEPIYSNDYQNTPLDQIGY